MAHRLSRSEKGKWVSEPSRPSRRPPVVIPSSDNSKLIEENNLTIIGRVTNPNIQKTRALVDFFLQHWSTVGRFTGRPLGPHLFQFCFETERDLQSVLEKSPYHFKKWMILLQRWEPNVSENFPAMISFWITVHGLPLHYWTDPTLDSIGSELGVVEAKEATRGRVRVSINGLKPLDMVLDISLPSGDIKKVELEYEKLEKHCFSCLSLSHEKDDCPYSRPPDRRDNHQSISQSRTLDRLVASKRAQDDRKVARGNPSTIAFRNKHEKAIGNHSSSRYDHYGKDKCRDSAISDDARRNHQHRGTRRPLFRDRTPTERAPQYEARLEASKYGDNPTHGAFASPRPPASQRLSLTRGSSGQARLGEQVWVEKPGQSSSAHASQTSKTPSPRPPREHIQITPQEKLAGSQERISALQRLSGSTPQDRTSALQRLSGSASRVPLLVNGVANSDSGRLQEVEIQYLEDNLQNNLAGSSGKASSSRAPAHERLSLPQSSPIRTLSEDRRHITITMDVPNQMEGSGQSLRMEDQPVAPRRGRKPTAAKATGKAAG